MVEIPKRGSRLNNNDTKDKSERIRPGCWCLSGPRVSQCGRMVCVAGYRQGGLPPALPLVWCGSGGMGAEPPNPTVPQLHPVASGPVQVFCPESRGLPGQLRPQAQVGSPLLNGHRIICFCLIKKKGKVGHSGSAPGLRGCCATSLRFHCALWWHPFCSLFQKLLSSWLLVLGTASGSWVARLHLDGISSSLVFDKILQCVYLSFFFFLSKLSSYFFLSISCYFSPKYFISCYSEWDPLFMKFSNWLILEKDWLVCLVQLAIELLW